MALSDQDREWARSIVAEAIMVATSSLMAYTHQVVNDHAGNCPNVSRIKYLLIGIGLTIGAMAGGVAGGPLIQLLIGM